MELADWKDTFIKLAKKVTLDEAALVAASINPFCVNNSIENAIHGGFENWPTAKMVASLLRDAVAAGDIAVDEVTVDTRDGYNQVLSGSDLLRHIALNPSHEVNRATFRGNDVWQWMVAHHLIDLKYGDGYSPTRDRILAIMRAKQASKHVNYNYGKQIQYLTDQVSQLTEQLQQAEEEIAVLKAKSPNFRHITPLLELVAEVQERYWGDTWDSTDADTNPKQSDIIDWVKSNPRSGSSSKRAEMVAVVAKPIV